MNINQLSLGKAKELVDNVLEKELTQSSIEGYSWKEQVITYGEIKQRWLLVENQTRKESDLKKLSERIEKEKEKLIISLAYYYFGLSRHSQ